MAEGRRQEAEGRRQKAEGGRQRAGGRRKKEEGKGKKEEGCCQVVSADRSVLTQRATAIATSGQKNERILVN
jgi:hypothetical protein